MWPPESLASRLYDIANWGLIAGLVIGVVSTVLLVWMGNVKEQYLRTSLAVTNERAAYAGERAGKAEKDAAEAREGTALAQAEAAKANQLAEQERLARVKIEERLAWRRISQKQHDEFVVALKPYAGSIAVVSGFDNADIESKTFARDIFNVLHDAGWRAPLDLSNTTSNLPVGVICRIDVSKPAGQALKIVLLKLHGAVIVPTRFDQGIGAIVIGLRPPP